MIDMDKEAREQIINYKIWFSNQLNRHIKKIELAHSTDEITKDFIYKSDILNILNGNEYDNYKPPLREYDVVSKYFDDIIIDVEKNTGNSRIKGWNIHDHKTSVAHNFYEVIVFISDKALLVLGHIKGDPYEYKYYYRDLYHLERLLKETFIQNCLYARYDNRPDLKLKGDKNNES